LGSLYVQHGGQRSLFSGEKDMITAVAKGSVTASLAHEASAILILSEDGGLAPIVSAFRPNCPIVAFCSNGKAARQLNLRRGIFPVIGLTDVSPDEKTTAGIDEAKAMGLVSSGDSIIVLDLNENYGGASFTTAIVP